MSKEPKTTGPQRTTNESPRRPYHLGVAIGLSTATYAASLAAVTCLQVADDRALLAEREPVRDAIDLLADHHEHMLLTLENARDRYDQAADGYDTLTGQVAAVNRRIDRLGRTVSALEGVGLRIPDRIDLPAVSKGSTSRPSRRTPAPAAPPATDGSTGASGGG
jgi:hypothetical protein